MKTALKPVMVLVSAYSTGRFLPYLFKGHGYECIHIAAHPDMPDDYTLGYSENKFLFREDIKFKGSLNSLLRELRKYPIKFVIPGSESGVWLADVLNEKFNLHAHNDFQLTHARRNKYLMQKALQEKGINSIPSFLIADKKSLEAASNQLTYPLVLKPLASSDAEGVCFCHDQLQLEEAFLKIIGTKDLYHQAIEQVLLQKKIEGKEFVVNSVSWEGQHFITDIWSNDKTKRQGEPLYDHQDFFSPTEGIGLILSRYIESVLDTLGIRFGAGHSEVICTEDGPVLIETGARLAGAFDPSSTLEALGYSQLSVLANAYLNPLSFYLLKDLGTSQVKKHIKIVSLISNSLGNIVDLGSLDYFYNLKSFFTIQHSMNLQQLLLPTTNLTNSPGNIYLISEDRVQLEKDYRAIRCYEKEVYERLIGKAHSLSSN